VKVHRKKKKKRKMKGLENEMVLAREGKVSIARISQGKEKNNCHIILFYFGFSM
jgi:hypothetical protein